MIHRKENKNTDGRFRGCLSLAITSSSLAFDTTLRAPRPALTHFDSTVNSQVQCKPTTAVRHLGRLADGNTASSVLEIFPRGPGWNSKQTPRPPPPQPRPPWLKNNNAWAKETRVPKLPPPERPVNQINNGTVGISRPCPPPALLLLAISLHFHVPFALFDPSSPGCFVPAASLKKLSLSLTSHPP